MPTRLIVNADDFGLTQGINRTIADLHTAGALTSATVMATGPAFDDAVRIAQDLPTLGIGCHIVLVDGTPAAGRVQIPSLLGPKSDPDRRTLRPSLADFAAAALRGHLNEREIEREAEAQIARLEDAGLTPTHLDTHKHTHLLPAVLRPLLRVAQRRGIRAIRNPFEPAWNLRLHHGSSLRRLQLNLLNRLRQRFLEAIQNTGGAIVTTDGTLGISTTGQLNPQTLAHLLAHLPEGTWELVCHPGENDPDLDRVATRLRAHREIERDALATMIPPWLAVHREVERIHFGQLEGIPSPSQPYDQRDPTLTATRPQ